MNRPRAARCFVLLPACAVWLLCGGRADAQTTPAEDRAPALESTAAPAPGDEEQDVAGATSPDGTATPQDATSVRAASPSPAPTSEAPTSEAPTSEAPTSEAPTSEAPSSEAPSSEAPDTEASVRKRLGWSSVFVPEVSVEPATFRNDKPQQVLGYPEGPSMHVRRRSGAVLAVNGELSLGSGFGYPNDARVIGDPRAYGRSSARPGYGTLLSVSGALTPALNVGFYFSYAKHGGGGWDLTSGGGGVRFDVFPFTGRRNLLLHNWAFYGLAGLGAVNVKYSAPGASYQDLDGTQSNLALGTFHEWRFGPLGLGPDVRLDSVFSRTAHRVSGTLGLRVSFYPSAWR